MKDSSIETREQKMVNFMNDIQENMRQQKKTENLMNSDHAKRRFLENEKSKAKGICLDRIFSKVYKDALPIDDSYKIAYGTDLDKEFRDFVQIRDPEGLVHYVQESIKHGSRPAKMLMEEVNSLVKNYYMEMGLNISKTSTEDMEFDPDDVEVATKIDDISDKMNTEEISEIIKDNVKKAAIADIKKVKDHQEEMKNLVDDLKNDPSITSEAAIDRRLGVAGLNNPQFYQPGLFEGIMINKTNLIKESGKDLDDVARNKKAYFESVKELTKLNVLSAFKLEDVNTNSKRIAKDYAMMRVPSSSVSFYGESEEAFEEGANMDMYRIFKEGKMNVIAHMKNANKLIKTKEYDKAIAELNLAKKELNTLNTKIDEIDAGSKASWIFGLFTGFIPLFGRSLLSLVHPLVGLGLGVDSTVKWAKALIKDSGNRKLNFGDFNQFKAGIKVRLTEFEKRINNTIVLISSKKKKEELNK